MKIKNYFNLNNVHYFLKCQNLFQHQNFLKNINQIKYLNKFHLHPHFYYRMVQNHSMIVFMIQINFIIHHQKIIQLIDRYEKQNAHILPIKTKSLDNLSFSFCFFLVHFFQTRNTNKVLLRNKYFPFLSLTILSTDQIQFPYHVALNKQTHYPYFNAHHDNSSSVLKIFLS